MDSKNRNYGLDALKILLAFMVLALHFFATGTGQVLNYATEIPWKWIAGGLTTLCYPAVNTYILITSFFLYKQNKGLEKTAKSLMKLWLAIVFYSVFGYVVVEVIIKQRFSGMDFIKRLFPITRGVWWYFTVYFGIVLISPFLNRMLNNLTKQEHRILLLMLLIWCSVLPMFVEYKGQLGTNYGYSLLWFTVLYITGAYIGKFCYCTDNNSVKIFIKFMLSYFSLSVLSYCITPIMSRWGVETTQAHYNSICTYLQAIMLLWAFLHLPLSPQYIKPISVLSSASMASYLFHCQEDIECILWGNIKVWEYANTVEMIPALVLTTGLLFFVSITIELTRRKFYSRRNFENRLIEKYVMFSRNLVDKL